MSEERRHAFPCRQGSPAFFEWQRRHLKRFFSTAAERDLFDRRISLQESFISVTVGPSLSDTVLSREREIHEPCRLYEMQSIGDTSPSRSW